MKDKDRKRCLRRLYSLHKANAKRRGIDFQLTRPVHAELVLSNCGYCGSGPSNRLKYSGLVLEYNGLDRIDSDGPYTKSNIIPSCRFCNSLKGSMPKEYWIDWINDVVELHGGQRPYPQIDSDVRSRKSYFKF